MSLATSDFVAKSRLRALLDHFAVIEDPREPWRVAHPLAEVLLLVVCATVADCDDYEGIAEWGKAHLEFLRRFLPYHHGVPGERWLTILMNRIDPALFSDAFTSWVRETWPDGPDHVAIDGKTSRRSHNRVAGKAPLHLVFAFATTSRLVLGQEAVADKTNEITAIPLLLERLAANDGLKGALVSIDAIATNPTIATAITDAGADYLLAVKSNQPTLRVEIESLFNDADPADLDTTTDHDKGHGRIEQRTVTVAREVDWLDGDRRFPGEVRLPNVATVLKVASRTELKDRCRFETRYTSHLPCSAPPAPPRRFAPTGPSRTTYTGSSTSSSATINRACAPGTARKTWQSSGTSPSISSEPQTTSAASSSGENAPVGIQITSPKSWGI